MPEISTALAERLQTVLGQDVDAEIIVAPAQQSYAEIIRQAETWRADRIVVGGIGRTGLERMLLGSVAERVVRTAACPVLVVRRPGAQ